MFENNINNDSYEYLKNIGSIIETPNFVEHLSAYENLLLYCKYNNYDFSNIDYFFNLVNLYDYKNMSVKKYSLGMKQRLAIAKAIINYSKLLILDEPLNGLDPEGIKEIRNLFINLKKVHNITIIISSHLLKELEEIVDRVNFIKKGK